MRIISQPRQGGKTTQMVEWVKADPDRVVLVMDNRERTRLLTQYDIPERQVVLASGAGRRLLGRRLQGVGVDNIDLLDWRTILELGASLLPVQMVTETRGH